MKINYKLRAPNAMYLTKQILNAFPFGHIQSTIYGPKRIGKTVYIVLSQMDAYSIVYPDRQYGYGVDWRFKKAMSNTIYSIQDLINKTESLQRKYDKFEGGNNPKQYIKKAIDEGVPEIEVHIDDGGVGFNKYIYFTDRAIVEELKNYMDTVGIVITGLPISTPSLTGVLGFIREYEGYRIHIIPKDIRDFRRIAKLYKVVQLPGGQTKPRRPRIDPYDCWLPSDLYRQYKKKRAYYLKQNLKRLRAYQRKRRERQEREDAKVEAQEKKNDYELNNIIKDGEETLNEYHKENII
jgi:hypothetical protein